MSRATVALAIALVGGGLSAAGCGRAVPGDQLWVLPRGEKRFGRLQLPDALRFAEPAE